MIRLSSACALTMLSTAALAADDPRLAESRQLSNALGQQLVKTLQTTMGAHGPIAAIEVCHSQAPEIARQLSSEGAKVGRTALRVRNPDNAPDAHELTVLSEFATSLRPDAPPPEHFSVEADGSARYMRAIPTGAPCLVCHGDNIAPPLAKAIAERYPRDEATGFKPGELRGAFVVRWPATNKETAR